MPSFNEAQQLTDFSRPNAETNEGQGQLHDLGRGDDVLLFDERDTSDGPKTRSGRRTEYSENYNVHSLRNGHVEALASFEYIVMNASHDQMDRVDRARLVEYGGAPDDSRSWNLGRVTQGDTIRVDGASQRGSRGKRT